ncbi:hypothetical protein PROFUN_07383 [Planoprotostelium fungivorum]|uniref:Uncharacterized protein n=1 Tax=Planoprotostelium fungivorum TaxID=1890364 RepID=A0A2P6MTG2_9EUKA|nr:hypothetical protein PROFUN_07383 [Planoprotostelium fungivorum]
MKTPDRTLFIPGINQPVKTPLTLIAHSTALSKDHLLMDGQHRQPMMLYLLTPLWSPVVL